MKILKVALSKSAPRMKDVLWLKPTGNGFALYAYDGSWQPLKLADASGVGHSISEFEQAGAAAALLGTADDTATAMTLYGLKAYVDSKTSTP